MQERKTFKTMFLYTHKKIKNVFHIYDLN